MRKLIRPFAAVVCIACLAVSGILVSAGSATTEDQVASPAKQMALTKKQIEGAQNSGATFLRTGGPGSHAKFSSFLRRKTHLKLRSLDGR
jgi:hypothetical protein